MHQSTSPVTSPTPLQAPQTANLRRNTPESGIDDALVVRFVGGSESAFSEIMERYRSKIFAVTLGVIRNHADAEELTQDTFIHAHRGLAKFRADSSLETWLYRIAVNLSRNRYWYWFRRRRQDTVSMNAALNATSPGTFSELVADQRPDPAQTTLAAEFSSLVKRCIKQLDRSHREILNLRSIQERSYVEISKILGITVGTVKSRISRARENLRANLEAACPDFASRGTYREWFPLMRETYGQPTVAAA